MERSSVNESLIIFQIQLIISGNPY